MDRIDNPDLVLDELISEESDDSSLKRKRSLEPQENIDTERSLRAKRRRSNESSSSCDSVTEAEESVDLELIENILEEKAKTKKAVPATRKRKRSTVDMATSDSKPGKANVAPTKKRKPSATREDNSSQDGSAIVPAIVAPSPGHVTVDSQPQAPARAPDAKIKKAQPRKLRTLQDAKKEIEAQELAKQDEEESLDLPQVKQAEAKAKAKIGPTSDADVSMPKKTSQRSKKRKVQVYEDNEVSDDFSADTSARPTKKARSSTDTLKPAENTVKSREPSLEAKSEETVKEPSSKSPTSAAQTDDNTGTSTPDSSNHDTDNKGELIWDPATQTAVPKNERIDRTRKVYVKPPKRANPFENLRRPRK